MQRAPAPARWTPIAPVKTLGSGAAAAARCACFAAHQQLLLPLLPNSLVSTLSTSNKLIGASQRLLSARRIYI